MDEQKGAVACVTAGEKLRAAPMRHRRPRPDDFEQVAPTKSMFALRHHYHTNATTIIRWAKESGVQFKTPRPSPSLPPPEGFAAVAVTMHRTALARRYGRDLKVIERWLEETGTTPAKPPVFGNAVARPAPAGFARVAPSMTRSQLRAHFSVGSITLARWLHEEGVEPQRALYTGRRAGTWRKPITAPVDTSLPARAADHLRRHYPSVYSCAILPPAERKRLPDSGRGRWIVGNKGALTADEVIALAESKGFNAREWARI